MFVSSGVGQPPRALEVGVDRQVLEVRVARRSPRARPMSPAWPLASTTYRASSRRSCPPRRRSARRRRGRRRTARSRTRRPSRTSTPCRARRSRAGSGRSPAATPGRRAGTAVRLAEVPAPRLAVGAPDHRRAPLREEALRLDAPAARRALRARACSPAAATRRCARAGTAPARQRHRQALPRQHRRRSRAGRSSPDDDDVAAPLTLRS